MGLKELCFCFAELLVLGAMSESQRFTVRLYGYLRQYFDIIFRSVGSKV